MQGAWNEASYICNMFFGTIAVIGNTCPYKEMREKSENFVFICEIFFAKN